MALACNGYEDQTLSATQQTFACKSFCELTLELNDPDFYLVVIDALNRLAVGLGTTGARVANITSEEMLEAVNNARCVTAVAGLTSTDPAKAKAMILAQINELVCDNV